MISVSNVKKTLGKPSQKILDGISFEVNDGEFISISGRSGSGKSTLLYLISGLDFPTSGDVLFDGISTKSMGSKEIHQFRNVNLGFIFQYHYLIPELNVLENILLPARIAKMTHQKINQMNQLLDRLGISELKYKYPFQLSGGEQQRVAIARSLIMSPRYLFADEPTGNLDSFNAKNVMNLLMEVHKNSGTTVCLVTHDPQFAALAQKEIFLVDGKIRN